MSSKLLGTKLIQQYSLHNARTYTECKQRSVPPILFTKTPTHKVVFIRHGESQFDFENKFCGWYDSELTAKGMKDSVCAGKLLQQENFCFDLGFTSVLSRAKQTLEIILRNMDLDVCTVSDWRLNERHYGALTGMDKKLTAKKYGVKQLRQWQCSFETPPPRMTERHPYYSKIRKNEMFNCGPPHHQFPFYESLKMTMRRTVPFWLDYIVPKIKLGRKIIISAHGNSLRAIIKHIDRLSDEKILKLDIPLCTPFTYEFDLSMKPIRGKRLIFLDSSNEAQAPTKKAVQAKN